jgi:hypothetical protein
MGKKDLLDLDDPLRETDEPMHESGIVPVPTAIPPLGVMRERQSTLVDDEVTEQARLASVLIESLPPRPSNADTAPAIRARLAPLDRIPEVAKTMAELGDDMREPKTAFVLGFIDGVLPLETIIEVTGLPEIDTLRVLDRLIAQGAVVFPSR